MSLDDRLSIVTTTSRWPSSVKLLLGSLLKYTHFRDHEIVFVGDRIDQPCTNPGYLVEGYETVEHYVEEYWIPKFEGAGFTFSLYKDNWEREDGRRPLYQCWSYGVTKAKNEWVIPVAEDNFMSPDWDYHMMKHFPEYPHDQFVYQMVWVMTCRAQCEDKREGDPGWLFWVLPPEYFDEQGNYSIVPLKESMLVRHYRENMRNAVLVEEAAKRGKLHFLRNIIHKTVVEKVSSKMVNHQLFDWRAPGQSLDAIMYHYQNEPVKLCCGDFPESLDCRYDDMLKAFNVKKVGCLDSFYYHLQFFRKKGMFIWDLGEP